MSFIDRARQAADRAAEQARVAAEKAGIEARSAAQRVRRGLTAERLAELIVRATALQERTNAELQAKHSPYRVTEISVQASLPPTIGFVIARLPEGDLPRAVVQSSEILEQRGEAAELDLGGSEAAPAAEGSEAQG
jgi:hypothetical protein